MKPVGNLMPRLLEHYRIMKPRFGDSLLPTGSYDFTSIEPNTMTVNTGPKNGATPFSVFYQSHPVKVVIEKPLQSMRLKNAIKGCIFHYGNQYNKRTTPPQQLRSSYHVKINKGYGMVVFTKYHKDDELFKISDWKSPIQHLYNSLFKFNSGI